MLTAFVSFTLPLIGALCCIRVFPLSMRKFTTIIGLWMYLLGCGYIAQSMPIALMSIFGEDQHILQWLSDTSPQHVAMILCSVGVGAGMFLIPISYFIAQTLKHRE